MTAPLAVSLSTPNMAERTRNFRWERTPLGTRSAWPATLRVSVDAMLASLHPMCLIWGPERILLYNDGYAPILGGRHPDALGYPTAEVWPELWPDLKPLIDGVFAGESVAFRDQPLTMTRNGFMEETWYDFAYSPVRDEAGEVAGLMNITSDSTARVKAQRERDDVTAELRENQAFMESVLAASTDCIKVVELDGSLSFMSEGGMGVMEVSDFNAIKGCSWPDFLKNGGVGLARDALDAAKEGRSSHFESEADTYLGTPKHWSVSVSPMRGQDGQVERVLSVSRDHTELAKARDQQRLLNGELAHRLKNTMSVVQAIALQSLRGVTEREAVKAFTDRITALASAHDVLVQQSWSTAKLDEVARATLGTFGADRFILSGPEVLIGSRATLALSLMLHELATNAAKYGALSVPDGTVAIGWGVTGSGDAAELRLTWEERGGPPAVAPSRKGFGSRIIGMGLTGSGGVDISYTSNGLSVIASAPLYQVQEA